MDNGTGTSMVYQFIRFLACVYNQYAQHKRYTGPVGRLMKVIYALRHHISPEGAQILLTYYENEHMLLPSDDNWIERLKEIVNTFFIPPDIAGTVRLRVLSIVTDVCMSTKDFYSDIMNTQIIYPMVQGAPQETNAELRQRTVDLIVLALSDAQNFNNEENMFDQLLDVLRRCASCKCLDDLRSSRIPIAASRGVASAIAQATTTGSTSATLGTHREDDRSRTATLRRSQSQSNHGSTSSPRIHYTMSKSSTASPLSASSPIISDGSITSEGQCCSGVPAMYGLVQLFEELLLGSDAKACLKVFRTITSISNNMDDLLCPYGGSMVVALDMMLCLRCPPDHRVYMTDDPFENDNSLMATIRETQNARRREAMNRDKSATMMMGSVSLPHHQQQQQQQQEQPQRPRYPSPVMLSHSENQEHREQGRVLPIGELLEAYIVVLSHSSNWELVLFVLKRLPIQLGNKHMFCGSPGTIEKLRRSITGWIHSRDFLKNVHSIPPTIKRNDVYVYAYNILVVLISYRRLFDKQRQDEIVFAFYMGLTQITAATKPCIHALSVCCHELPLSVTKMLNEILQRMSQIISVSSVSVHILEFLSTLARLPGLYANFTSDMYKPVFAIALNYLQHTQSSSASSTTSSPMSTPPTPHHHHHHHHHQQTPPASSSSSSSQQQQQQQQNSKNSKDAQQITTQNALSQYVLIMAYLVITVWFTAVPLRERRKHVSFIIGRLLSATPIGKGIDEQTFTCIDMLSRFSFADVSLSPEKSLVSKILMGDPAAGPSPLTGAGNTTANSEGGIRQSMRTWVYGHTLLTLKTAKALGWVEMTIRRPSGTVSMMCNIENRIKSNAIDYQTLPALLMMQYTPDLMASRMLQQRESGNAPGNDTSSPLPLVESGLGITFENLAAAANIATQQYQQQQQNSGNVDEEQQEQQSNNDSSPASGATEGNSSGSGSGTVSIGGQTPMTAGNNNNNNIHEQLDNVIRQVLADPETPAQSISSSGLLRRMDQPLDPGFLFLQLSNYPDLTRIGENIPPLPEDEATTRSLGILDRIPVVDFHKIGVLYVGKGQHTEVDILANTHGSPEYVKLLNALGEIELLKGRTDNTGGLDREMDIDGRFAYFWKDDVTRVIFHVATLMPTNLERDPQCSNKKRHIGNDFVTIVYNDSGKDYAFDTLPGQFNFCNIVITPHSISSFTPSTASSISPSSSTLSSITTSSDSDNNTFFKVEMQRRPDMPEIGPISEPKLVSGQSLPHLVRQTALHANIFAQVFQSVSAGGGRREYVSPWKERLRQIKRIRDRVTKSTTNDQQAPPSSSSTPAITVNNKVPFEQVLDFTKYT
ncbi:hypothetical protein INT45_011266 [Circinella minor]|uniref:Rap-GAP domain-containing protein n=1 Tax=Circinella minor TaxID=1195481 RepID=A0A8H7S0U3_9FUNG|nr:hypothetical protein INT45_011266 [Circinella minor]